MSSSPSASPGLTVTFAAVVAGIGLVVLAWLLPVNLKSLTPAMLSAAGQGTTSVSGLGQQLVDAEKIGPATLVLAAARQVGDPGAAALERSVTGLAVQQADVVAWGGWDPFLEPLLRLRRDPAPADSTPVLNFMLPAAARATLRDYLANTRSLGVQALLALRGVPDTGRFVPAVEPGGQPLDAMILLGALLYQGEQFSAPLQLELRQLAEQAADTGRLGELEPFFIDLLSLSQRLDWVQLGELLRRTEDSGTVGEYAHLARVASDQLAVLYAAALFSGSADRVAEYLIRFGKTGAEDLQFALGRGQGAVRQLVQRQVSVNRERGPVLADAADFALLHPRATLALKYLGYLLGAFLVLRGLDRRLFPRDEAPSLRRPHMQNAVLALFCAGLLVLATEPYLLKAAPLSEYRFKIVMPLLANSAIPPPPAAAIATPAMNTSTVVSIGFFALMQVAIYIVCLRKLAEIQRQELPPLLKLRLVENEDNLFDSGLYLGMMGTAAALVMQVLGLIDPNLLAAYSSNLFGLVCVALVKIRHVRGCKRQLIMEAEAAVPVAS